MSNAMTKRIVAYVLILVVFQVPLLHNWAIMGMAFPFPYIGFIILMPHFINRSGHMIIGFLLGLTMDLFSNTPGMHASVAVLIGYFKTNWLGITADLGDDDLDISMAHLGFVRYLFFSLPLIFVHHLALFILENEGVKNLSVVLLKTFWSSLLSFSIITLAMLTAIRPKKRI